MALVEAKRLKHLEVINVRALMSTNVTQWEKNSLEVNEIIGAGIVEEEHACKHKWQSTISDFKPIADYHK